ncbi:unnamed protein product, partial [Strongylus vulgaris]
MTILIQSFVLIQVQSFKASTFRGNLYYDVFMKDHLNVAPEVYQGSGIIYCRTRDECDQVAQMLSIAHIRCLSYHAGLSNKMRDEVQNKWMKNEIPVIAATIAFGMGIDKPDVRFVVHWTCPQNLAAYYQESGRAGRDGQRSYCRIYYSQSDKDFLHFLVKRDLAMLKVVAV